MIKRALRPLMEPLEEKALQSSGGLLAHHASLRHARAASPGTSLVATLTTDRRVYHPGQPVVMTLHETNWSNQNVTIALGPSLDGFYVTQRGATVWRSNGGIQPMFVEQRVVPAHGSISLSATWDPQASGVTMASPGGVFVVHSQLPGARGVSITVRGGQRASG